MRITRSGAWIVMVALLMATPVYAQIIEWQPAQPAGGEQSGTG